MARGMDPRLTHAALPIQVHACAALGALVLGIGQRAREGHLAAPRADMPGRRRWASGTRTAIGCSAILKQ